MSLIKPLDWDSHLLGVPVGRLNDCECEPTLQNLQAYGLVLARVPQQRNDMAARLQTLGFRYIGLDLQLVAEPDEQVVAGDVGWNICRVSRCIPDFRISGFHIADSRLMLDPACRARLPMDFWDRLAYEHCTEFAETVICAVDTNNHLAGFVSCLMRSSHLDLFMVAVHPAHQGEGMGGALLRSAAALAREQGLMLSTSVMANNVRGFNFYIRHNYLVEGGEIVMHRWQEGAQGAQ